MFRFCSNSRCGDGDRFTSGRCNMRHGKWRKAWRMFYGLSFITLLFVSTTAHSGHHFWCREILLSVCAYRNICCLVCVCVENHPHIVVSGSTFDRLCSMIGETGKVYIHHIGHDADSFHAFHIMHVITISRSFSHSLLHITHSPPHTLCVFPRQSYATEIHMRWEEKAEVLLHDDHIMSRHSERLQTINRSSIDVASAAIDNATNMQTKDVDETNTMPFWCPELTFAESSISIDATSNAFTFIFTSKQIIEHPIICSRYMGEIVLPLSQKARQFYCSVRMTHHITVSVQELTAIEKADAQNIKPKRWKHMSAAEKRYCTNDTRELPNIGSCVCAAAKSRTLATKQPGMMYVIQLSDCPYFQIFLQENATATIATLSVAGRQARKETVACLCRDVGLAGRQYMYIYCSHPHIAQNEQWQKQHPHKLHLNMQCFILMASIYQNRMCIWWKMNIYILHKSYCACVVCMT